MCLRTEQKSFKPDWEALDDMNGLSKGGLNFVLIRKAAKSVDIEDTMDED